MCQVEMLASLCYHWWPTVSPLLTRFGTSASTQSSISGTCKGEDYLIYNFVDLRISNLNLIKICLAYFRRVNKP